MNYTQLQAEVVKVLGNLHSSHPLYSDVGNWINRATNRVVMLALGKNKGNLSLFPELQTSWTDTTINGQNYLAMPSDALAIQHVYSFDQSTAPNLSTTASKSKLGYVSPQQFELIPRTSSTTGYPRIWTRKGNRIYFWPTPGASYLTYLHLYGLQREVAMSSGSDTPLVSDIWHDAYVNEAAYIGATKLGWDEDAQRLKNDVLEEINMASSVAALQDQDNAGSLQLENDITRAEVYGA